MFYFGGFAVLADPDGSGVKAIGVVPKIIFIDIDLGDFLKFIKFWASNAFFRQSVFIALQFSGFYFHKHDLVFFFGDNINFSYSPSFGILKIKRDYFIALFLEIFRGRFFTQPAKIWFFLFIPEHN